MDRIFSDAIKNTKSQSQKPQQEDGDNAPKNIPKGVVLGKDGKPYAKLDL